MNYRVYIKPFDSFGVYEDDFIEVTDDVLTNSLTTIKKSIDSTEYDTGVYKYNSFSFEIKNDDGHYSDIDKESSIFRFKRSDSIVKVTWTKESEYSSICGFAICGESLALNEEVTIFEGLLSDEASQTDVINNTLKFKANSLDSIFSRTETPYSSLSIGFSVKGLITTVLNVSPISDILTLNASNYTVENDIFLDSIADFENTTVKEALDDLLLIGNCVLYIEGRTVIVTPRTESSVDKYTFYGQGSDTSSENIQDLSKIKNGLNKTFNFVTWQDTTLVQKDTTSITNNGLRKKEIDISYVTDTTKRNTILASITNEFKNPKQEFEITTFMDHDTLALSILDKVQVDYPQLYFPANSFSSIPRYDLARYDVDFYPDEILTAVIDSASRFKIMQIKLDLKKFLITFKLREI